MPRAIPSDRPPAARTASRAAARSSGGSRSAEAAHAPIVRHPAGMSATGWPDPCGRRPGSRCRARSGDDQDGDMIGQLHSVVIDAPDAHALATFYAELLGMEVEGSP